MNDVYFLGGADLEMAEIRALLATERARVIDHGLSWGAALSHYRAEIEAVHEKGETPVAIELTDDMPADWPARERLNEIDHHGARAGHGRPTSLEQLFARLKLPPACWTRRMALVSANDRGHVAAMREIGASREEMAVIRAEDRAAQGVTPAMERQALDDVKARVIMGRLTVIETALKTSTPIADAMNPALGGPGHDRLLVVMSDTLALFGDGALISALAAAFPGSWWGGDLPAMGFWGMGGAANERAAALAMIMRA
jgi:hypothetical protein